jgi:hypothetical protein
MRLATKQVVKVDGKDVEKFVLAGRSELVTRLLIVDGTKVFVTRKDGKVIDPRDLPTLLERPVHMVMFYGKADPFYLQVLRDDVLLLRLAEDEEVIRGEPAAPK